MNCCTLPIISSGEAPWIGLQQVAGTAAHQQLERLVELPLVDFDEFGRCHVDEVKLLGSAFGSIAIHEAFQLTDGGR